MVFLKLLFESHITLEVGWMDMPKLIGMFEDMLGGLLL